LLNRHCLIEVRRVLSGKWPVNVVNRAVKANNRAGLAG
jgi:hypothetical protein